MEDEKQPAVYIMSSGARGTLYIGVTSQLWNRVSTHKQSEIKGFTKKYSVHSLVWYEHHDVMETAIRREKQLKKWNRDWKVRMLETLNPHGVDLHDDIDVDRRCVETKLGSSLRGNDGP